MNVDLTEEDIIKLQQTTDNDVINTNSNKCNPDDQLKDTTEGQKRIIFPAFDLSTKIIQYGNRSSRVTTVAYEIKYYPANFILLKPLIIK